MEIRQTVGQPIQRRHEQSRRRADSCIRDQVRVSPPAFDAAAAVAAGVIREQDLIAVLTAMCRCVLQTRASENWTDETSGESATRLRSETDSVAA